MFFNEAASVLATTYAILTYPFTDTHQENCFEGYGCFSLEEPFTNSRGYLPQSPDEVNVTIDHHTRRGIFKAEVGYVSEIRTKRTKVIIHGYMGSKSVQWVEDMAKELLRDEKCNVFVVNWKMGADESNYYQAVANTRMVGKVVAKYLKWFRDHYEIAWYFFHLIGGSLGAHIAGYIGQEMKIGRITGLDPASPGFKGVHESVSLSPTDAFFVDVIHTDDYFGLTDPVGKVDFFVNGGYDQPGCNWLSDWTSCSHSRAFELLTYSINGSCRFYSYPCDINDVKEEKTLCTSCGVKGCNNMGYYSWVWPSGVFYTPTKDEKPYCYGYNPDIVMG